MATTVPVYMRLGSEFMPPLDEGSLLYMPTTLPGLSVTGAQSLLQTMDELIMEVPEVERVFIYQRANGPGCSDFETFGIDGKPAAGLLRKFWAR